MAILSTVLNGRNFLLWPSGKPEGPPQRPFAGLRCLTLRPKCFIFWGVLPSAKRPEGRAARGRPGNVWQGLRGSSLRFPPTTKLGDPLPPGKRREEPRSPARTPGNGPQRQRGLGLFWPSKILSSQNLSQKAFAGLRGSSLRFPPIGTKPGDPRQKSF